ncbi:histone acetyltransferase [Histoplasma capsulatum var. duboisii H88]|uniref:Enhancer of polycomb-like protein n=1 Tax=Ajellomyces capsulatus (strain H88) TaxID=544711 RepID=A0A8A1L9W9_AJEC8|nr:histone acetyltransferase [Histoplasma capsulatum var. duboisii H88]
MSRLGGMMRSTRPKKLTSKQPIPIFREDQIDIIEDDLQTTLQAIDTGVEKAEETEYHFQAAINAAARGNIAQAHIPTPETVTSSIKYDTLYRPTFSQPATYIRFSSTVEDCSGCSYNLVEEDDVALKIMNQKKGASTQCTEDQFEEFMAFFEETAQTKQPFASVDSPPVLSYSEMEHCFDGLVDENARRFARDIYEHWKSRRTKYGNRPLQTGLKFETGQETDDGDPYVCFRRREVRQIRKTRGRDAQSAEKLRRLRKELEEARELVAMVRQRELARKELLVAERQVFVQRAEVKEMKRKLGIKDDDDDLVNQRQPKKRPPEVPASSRPVATQLRMPPRPSGQPGEDLVLLEDVQADKESEVLREIKQNIAKHSKWNEGYVDWTTAPLTPNSDHSFDAEFRPAITTEYLPTPPASESSDHSRDALEEVSRFDALTKFARTVQQCIPSDEESSRNMPSFRRRIGRGGRMMIDRRNLPFRNKSEADPIKLERFKYDQDDEDMDPIYEMDEFDIQIMQHRAYLSAKSRDQAAAQAQFQAHVQAQRRLQGETPVMAGANNSHNGTNNVVLKGPAAQTPS